VISPNAAWEEKEEAKTQLEYEIERLDETIRGCCSNNLNLLE
jgi:hypothetical protein